MARLGTTVFWSAVNAAEMTGWSVAWVGVSTSGLLGNVRKCVQVPRQQRRREDDRAKHLGERERERCWKGYRLLDTSWEREEDAG